MYYQTLEYEETVGTDDEQPQEVSVTQKYEFLYYNHQLIDSFDLQAVFTTTAPQVQSSLGHNQLPPTQHVSVK